MSKKLLILIAAIIVVLIVIVGGYFLLFHKVVKPRPVSVTHPSPSPRQSIPPASAGTLLTPDDVVSPQLGRGGSKIRYFDRTKGLMQEIGFSGESLATLSSAQFKNIYSVLWSPTADSAIVEYMDASGVAARTYFPLGSPSSTQLSNNIHVVTWSPDGKQILYHYRDAITGDSYLAISNPDGTSKKVLAPFTLDAINLFWPTAQEALVLEKPAPGQKNTLWKIDTKSGVLTVLAGPVSNLAVLPSPTKPVLFTSFTELSEAGGEVLRTAVIDYTGKTLSWPLFSTFSDKCTWASGSGTLYCAVPAQSDLSGGNMLTDFWRGNGATQDELVKYDYVKNEASPLAVKLGLDAVSLVVSRQENFVGFINRADSGLYGIKL